MKVEIDIDKITLSPSVKYNVVSNEDMKYSLLQLKSQLRNGNNSSILVSGYRGAGKTTLIKSLIKEFDNERSIFVELNFTKRDELSIIQRKLIRELYLSLESNDKFKLIKDKKLVNQIKLLYDHTFFEISNISNWTKLKEHNFELSSKLNFMKLIKSIAPVIAMLISTINLKINIIPFITSHLEWTLLVISIFWFLISNTEIKKVLKRNSSEIEEHTRKSLFDNEIAEYHLKSVLESLNKEKFKVIFVFDELDKIDNDSEMEGLISDMKPLLLSNLASFIVISGQKMYYKLLSSSLIDDSLMASIFSKSIHVPLVNESDLDKAFESYLVDKSVINEKHVEIYKKSLILNSNRTLRMFTNKLLQDIVWEDEKAYIEIDESDISKYETDSKILSVVGNIIDKQIDNNEYDIGIRDFLIFQIYLWIKKMKLRGSTYFSISDIYNFESDYSEDYHIWYEIELNDLCNVLSTDLVDAELLEIKVVDDERHFRWMSTADISLSKFNNSSNSKYRYLKEIIELEEYSRELLYELKIDNGLKTKSFLNINDILVKNNIVSNSWLDERNISLIKLSNRIKLGEKIENDEIERLSLSNNIINKMKVELFEGYCNHFINQYLGSKNYKVFNNKRVIVNERSMILDILAKHNEKPDIIFEIKFRKRLRANDLLRTVDSMVSTLNSYKQLNDKNNHLVILFFSSESDENTIRIAEDKLRNIRNDSFYNGIHPLIVSEPQKIFNNNKIEEFINSIVNMEYGI